MKIPSNSMSKDDVFQALEQKKSHDFNWRSGKAFAYVYDAGREVDDVAKRAYTMFLSENGLDPTFFLSLLRLENDVVAMARAHLQGDAQVVGNFTSGGTESIMLAVKSARDYALARNPSLTHPEIVLPESAHAAFHKAAHYMGLRVISTPVDPVTFRADVNAVREAITERTVLIVGSASEYAHGIVDPITELGQLAIEKNVWLHVDGCIGGFLLQYFRQLGAEVPPFDFSVPGVNSMSMDLHKYAFCPKGASVVLYRNKELRKHQIFACASWQGYTMVNNTIQSSKSGGPLAAAWAVMHFIGDEGYRQLAKGLLEAKNELVDGINAIPGLRVMGKPEMSLIAFTSDSLPIFALADAMKKRGWYVQPQLAYGVSKENLHLSLGPSNRPHIPDLLAALRDSVKEVEAKGVDDSVKGMIHSLASELSGPSGFDKLEMLKGMLGVGGDAPVPEEMAMVNDLMNALPRRIQEVLLTEFVNDMFLPTP